MTAGPVVWREPVQDAWIDYNGHLSEPYYVLVFGHATDAFMVHIGMTPELRDAVVDGCEREADGRSVDDLIAERDRGVIAILRALGRV